MIGTFGTVTNGTGGLRSRRTSGDHQNYSIFENSDNTEKSPGDLIETCCHSNFSERPSANADVKNSKIIIKHTDVLQRAAMHLSNTQTI